MSDGPGDDEFALQIRLLDANERLLAAQGAADRLSSEIGETSDEITALEAELGLDSGDELPGAPRRTPAPSARPAASLDDLLTEAEVRRIERRYSADVSISARLDGYDVLAAIAAGTVGAVVDNVLSKTPATSPLTSWLRSELAASHDNGLSDVAKVPYDRVAGTGVPGMSSWSHRFQTLGHDPLLGLVFGVADILRGQMTATDPTGAVHVLSYPQHQQHNLVAALGTQILHMLSDVGTPAGLPLPGFTALGAISAEIGERPVAEVAREMYIRGYDSWHMLAMASAPSAVEITCRAYWAIRSVADDDFIPDPDLPVSEQPRYEALSLLAHGVAAACDVAQVAATGNPMALNWAQWMAYTKRLAEWLHDKQMTLPVQHLADRAGQNRRRLTAGWDRLLDGMDSEDVPSAVGAVWLYDVCEPVAANQSALVLLPAEDFSSWKASVARGAAADDEAEQPGMSLEYLMAASLPPVIRTLHATMVPVPEGEIALIRAGRLAALERDMEALGFAIRHEPALHQLSSEHFGIPLRRPPESSEAQLLPKCRSFARGHNPHPIQARKAQESTGGVTGTVQLVGDALLFVESGGSSRTLHCHRLDELAVLRDAAMEAELNAQWGVLSLSSVDTGDGWMAQKVLSVAGEPVGACT